jgi:hypothetical protein
MPSVRYRTSKPPMRRVYVRLAMSAFVAALLAGAYLYLDYQFQLAEIIGGEPRLAASDQPALRSLLVGGAAVPLLQAAGRVFSIPPRTRCRLLWSDSHSPCRAPRDFPVRVRLLEGPRRGQAAWLCFGDLRWPLHALP